MPRNDGNKSQKEDLEKMELTLKNIEKNEQFLAENPGVDFTLEEFIQLRIGKLRALGTELQTVITLFLFILNRSFG